MALPRLEVTVRDTDSAISQLEKFRFDALTLEPKFQYLIAALVMLRLFSILEAAIEEVACKLVAGAPYTNGIHPTRLVPARSIEGAKLAMLNHGRQRPKYFLRWTSVSDIRDSTLNVLPSNEPFLNYAQRYANVLSEMRKVRNFLAHRSNQSRSGYRQVVRSVYGASSRVSVEAFLTSSRGRPRAKIDEYLSATKIMVSELARG